MQISAVQKYRDGKTLNNKDAIELAEAIDNTQNITLLESYIYVYSKAFFPTVKLEKKVRYYLDNQEPGLTAVCLKALESWNKIDRYAIDVMVDFMDYTKFDEWYDEIIFSSRYLIDNKDILETSDKTLLLAFLHDARRLNEPALFDVLDRSAEIK